MISTGLWNGSDEQAAIEDIFACYGKNAVAKAMSSKSWSLDGAATPAFACCLFKNPEIFASLAPLVPLDVWATPIHIGGHWRGLDSYFDAIKKTTTTNAKVATPLMALCCTGSFADGALTTFSDLFPSPGREEALACRQLLRWRFKEAPEAPLAIFDSFLENKALSSTVAQPPRKKSTNQRI